MIKVYQETENDCFRACVASIFELSLSDVPDFCNIYSPEIWFEKFNSWLYKHYKLRAINTTGAMYDIPFYTIGSGLSINNIMHGVVCKNGRIVHDPSPLEGDIEITEMMYFIVNPLGVKVCPVCRKSIKCPNCTGE